MLSQYFVDFLFVPVCVLLYQRIIFLESTSFFFFFKLKFSRGTKLLLFLSPPTSPLFIKYIFSQEGGDAGFVYD